MAKSATRQNIAAFRKMLKRAKKSEPETSFSVLYFASVAQENAPPKSVVRAAQKGDKGKA